MDASTIIIMLAGLSKMKGSKKLLMFAARASFITVVNNSLVKELLSLSVEVSFIANPKKYYND